MLRKEPIWDSLRTLRRLLGLLGPVSARYWTGLLMVVPQNLFFNIIMSISLVLLLQSAERRDVRLFMSAVAFVSASLFIFLVVVAVGGYIYACAVARANGHLRKRVFGHLQRMPMSWFEDRHSGDMISRLTNDVQAAEQAWSTQLGASIAAIIMGVGSGVTMFLLDWRAALLSIGLGILGLLANSLFIGPMKRESDAVQRSLGLVTERLADMLAAAPVIRIFSLSSWIERRFGACVGCVFRHDLRRARWSGGQAGMSALTTALNFVGLILIGSFGVYRGWISFSTLVGVVQLTNGITWMFSSLGNYLTGLQTSLAGVDRLFELLDAPCEDIAAGSALGSEIIGSALRVKDLHFSYEPGAPVLKGVDFSINPGETVAIVGSSGSGKSTLLKLLLGFYPFDEGDILLWGQSVRTLSLEVVRSQIAYVPQVNYLFSGTIYENIEMGRPGAVREDIEEAARAAMAHDFIMALPQGYDTPVGERGAQLSGGQRQRIAIARAFLRNAPILLLDEATASLDSQSEHLVREALEQLKAGRTVIVVAHRLSTVHSAKYILVLENGRIVERGSHRELIRTRGRYAYYYNLQFAEQMNET
ncbi:MAG: ABC transporter ATP-binding protein [Clostridiales bacterium]|nr:ABC transporter ATP-binding protein [Clostridiales bacterium]